MKNKEKMLEEMSKYTKEEIKESRKKMADDFLKFALEHTGISLEKYNKFVEDLESGKKVFDTSI